VTKPESPPEGRLIEDARKARIPRLSQRKAAELAGLSEGRWRQIVTGYQSISAGVYAIVRGPAETVANMARAVGVTAEQMRSVGRYDVADLLVPEVFEQQLPSGWIVRGEQGAAEDPEVLSFAEEILEEALRLARARHYQGKTNPNG
jgi:hypothetical protein